MKKKKGHHVIVQISNFYQGHFVTMETTSLERQKNGTVKRSLSANGNLACLTYWYRSFGYTSNILKVYVIGNGKELALEKKLLGIETSWKKGNMTIYVNYSRFSVSSMHTLFTVLKCSKIHLLLNVPKTKARGSQKLLLDKTNYSIYTKH